MINKVLYLHKNFYTPQNKFLATPLTVPSHRGIEEGPLTTPRVRRFDRPIALDPLAVFEQFEHCQNVDFQTYHMYL